MIQTPTLTNLWRVYGPPGCGKTTWIARQVERVIKEGKYAPEQIMVLSFSRAAFREFTRKLKENGVEVPDANLGTVHSMGYRALLQPGLAVDSHGIGLWNGGGYGFRLSARVRGKNPGGDVSVDPYADEVGTQGERGDALLNEITDLRNRLIPFEEWNLQQREFHQAWELFKKEQDLIDFSDMISKPIQEIPFAPGNPAVIFVDEAQDLNPLQHALIRHWGWSADKVVLIGDDDQTIYSFQGANVDEFLHGEAVGEIVLGQSYRVPQLIQAYAKCIIERVGGLRKAKEYKPRNEVGEVHRIDDWEMAYKKGLQLIQHGKTVMYMASAKYLLEPLLKLLKESGLPFHNPYAPTRKEFNPLGAAAPGQLAGWQRVAAFVKPVWTGADVKAWVEHLSVRGVFHRGASSRSRLEKLEKGEIFDASHEAWEELTEEAAGCLLARDLGWYSSRLLASASSGMKYAIQVCKQHGADALYHEPKINVGTIHSFKGAEADVVFVHPTLSTKATEEFNKGDGEDAVHRLFYVAVTRAKESLYLLDHNRHMGPMGYPWPSWLSVGVDL